uniref:Uncharacterized protein n=1 Tax=Aceria tosichella TaxID=561515 RepID=A0A6G1SGL2_9ACAR
MSNVMHRVQVIRLASLCAILFLVSGFLTSRRATHLVNCTATSNETITNEAQQQSTTAAAAVVETTTTTTTAGVGLSTTAAWSSAVTNSDLITATESRGYSSSAPLHVTNGELEVQRWMRRKQAGKILDYSTSASRERDHHHHLLLIPKRLNSTGLARLIGAPFQSRLSRVEHEPRSRARSITERGNDNNNTSPTKDACVVQGRSRLFGDVLRGARNLVASGITSIEQRAGSLLYLGSNLLATLIPLASLLGFGSSKLHHSSSEPTGATNSSAIPNRGAGLASLLAPPQKLAQYAAGSGGIQSRVEYVMDLLERSVEHLPIFPRLHPQECIKRSICEAHNEPNKYGAIGLTLRLLFPATNFSATSAGEQDNMEYKVINKYRHAAGYGLLRRLDSTGNSNMTNNNNNIWPSSSGACKEKYEDCLVSLLDVVQKLVDLFVN